FLYILTFIPFPFFGWITLFILSCIWVYLFLRFCVWSINRIFKKNIRVKKIYLALPYPLIMLSWFGFSFVPLEWQPSFREFERLCREEGGDTTTIYNQEIYDRIRTTGYGVDLKTELTHKSWRIKKKEIYYYEYGTENLFEKYETYLWTDMGMIPKGERIIGCASIGKTKELIKQRWWLK
ncbi:hypothetical protein, partial [Helicobacter pullorum]|uniref:hypothetical protein n=1 Tax=Helicobacter pullorum TaxID=35818 RepID=UPI0008169E83